MRLSIIIPVYNEEQTIGEIVDRVWAVPLGDIEKEIIIANDGSSDGTRGIIAGRAWSTDPRVKIYDSPINLGKGAAVRLGLHFATGDIVLIQDVTSSSIPTTASTCSRRFLTAAHRSFTVRGSCGRPPTSGSARGSRTGS